MQWEEEVGVANCLYVHQIDMKKMPLGKLSRRQMKSAYSVLTELQQEVAGAASPARILDASNRCTAHSSIQGVS